MLSGLLRVDRRIADESAFPVAVPPAADERSVRTDQPTLFFRNQALRLMVGDHDDTGASRRGALRVLSSTSSSGH